MSFPDDAQGTFEGRHGCPSELVVDRFVIGELSERSRGELEAHLAGCDVCRHRVDLRRPEVSLPELDREAMLAAIHARAAEPAPPESAPPPARPDFWRSNRWMVLLPLFAALGALVVWLARR